MARSCGVNWCLGDEGCMRQRRVGGSSLRGSTLGPLSAQPGAVISWSESRARWSLLSILLWFSRGEPWRKKGVVERRSGVREGQVPSLYDRSRSVVRALVCRDWLQMRIDRVGPKRGCLQGWLRRGSSYLPGGVAKGTRVSESRGQRRDGWLARGGCLSAEGVLVSLEGAPFHEGCRIRGLIASRGLRVWKGPRRGVMTERQRFGSFTLDEAKKTPSKAGKMPTKAGLGSWNSEAPCCDGQGRPWLAQARTNEAQVHEEWSKWQSLDPTIQRALRFRPPGDLASRTTLHRLTARRGRRVANMWQARQREIWTDFDLFRCLRETAGGLQGQVSWVHSGVSPSQGASRWL